MTGTLEVPGFGDFSTPVWHCKQLSFLQPSDLPAERPWSLGWKAWEVHPRVALVPPLTFFFILAWALARARSRRSSCSFFCILAFSSRSLGTRGGLRKTRAWEGSLLFPLGLQVSPCSPTCENVLSAIPVSPEQVAKAWEESRQDYVDAMLAMRVT